MFLLLMLACARDPEPPQGPGVRLSLDVPAEAELPADPLFTVRDDDDATITADLRPGDTAEIALTPGRHSLWAYVRWEDPAQAGNPDYAFSSCDGNVDVIVPETGFAEVSVPIGCRSEIMDHPGTGFTLPDGDRATCNWADAWGILPDGRGWELHLALPRADFDAHADVTYDLPLDGTTARLRLWDSADAGDSVTFNACSDVETTWAGRALDATGTVHLVATSAGMDADCGTWTYDAALSFTDLATAAGSVDLPAFAGTLGFFGGCYGR